MRTAAVVRMKESRKKAGNGAGPSTQIDMSKIISQASQMAQELDDSDDESDSKATLSATSKNKPSVSFSTAIDREFGPRQFTPIKPIDVELQIKKIDADDKKKTNEDVNLLVCELINFNDPNARSFWSSQVMGKTFNAGTHIGVKDHYVEFPDSVANLMVPSSKEKDKKIRAHIGYTVLRRQCVENGFTATTFIDRIRKLALAPAEKKSIFACTNVVFFQIPILRTKATHEFMVALSQIDVADPSATYNRIMDWKTKYFIPEPKPAAKPISTK